MSESSPADTNAETNPAEAPTDAAPAPDSPANGATSPEPTKPVSTEAQEDAAHDRAESGGYT